MKQAIILAGGKGVRLSSRLEGLPKTLVNFNDKPLIWYQLKLLEKYGYNEVLILVNYLAEKVEAYIRNSGYWKLSIKCIRENTPLGTAGAILSVFEELKTKFLVIYGDTMLNVDLKRFEDFHDNQENNDITLFVHPNDHPYDSDLIEITDDNKVTAIHASPHKPNLYLRNLVNAALYIINRDSLFRFISLKDFPLDFGKDLLPKLLKSRTIITAYNSPEYIKDCGTPERLDQSIDDYKKGKISKASLETSQKAIFLDRDGTINHDVGHLNNELELVLLDGVEEAINLVNKSDFRCIVITNQPVIARGECSFADVEKIHSKLETKLGQKGAFLDRIYFCPHHPDKGFKSKQIQTGSTIFGRSST